MPVVVYKRFFCYIIILTNVAIDRRPFMKQSVSASKCIWIAIIAFALGAGLIFLIKPAEKAPDPTGLYQQRRPDLMPDEPGVQMVIDKGKFIYGTQTEIWYEGTVENRDENSWTLVSPSKTFLLIQSGDWGYLIGDEKTYNLYHPNNDVTYIGTWNKHIE